MTFAHSLRRCTLSTRSLKSVRIGPDKDICERAKVTADGGRITIRAEPPLDASPAGDSTESSPFASLSSHAIGKQTAPTRQSCATRSL